MISLSKQFRRALYANDRSYEITADITLLDGTLLHLDNTKIWSGGVSFDDAVSEDESFTALGSTVINSAMLTIDNRDEAYSAYDFSNATVVIYVGKTFGITKEVHKKGTYHVDDASYSTNLITLELVDYMAEFDAAYDTTLTYPATLAEIVQDACSKCDVSLQTYTFPHSTYTVNTKPDSESLTYREVIGWCATIAGCFARCNRDGKLELKWFDQDTLESRSEGYDGGVFKPWLHPSNIDGGAFNPWNEGTVYDGGTFSEDKPIHYITSLYKEKIGVDDVVITQVKVLVEHETDEGSEIKTYTSGSEGYTIEISNNDFITVETAQDVTAWLGAQLIGLTFRQANVSHANNPSIEAGDIAVVWDSKGREHPILVTRTAFTPYGQQQTVCGSETPKRNSATRYSSRSKAYVDARKLVKREMTDREKKLEELANALDAHSGLYSSTETQADGSTIYYLHDMPDLDDSQIIWKMTKEAWGVTTDGGQHWNAGMTVDGDTIVRILTAVGVNAEWINAGALSITKNKGTNSAYETFYANADSGTLRIHAKDTSGNDTFVVNTATGEIYLSASKTKIGDKTLATYVSDNGQMNKTQIFNKLTDNGATQGIYMTNGKLYLNADYMAAGTIASVNGNTQWDLDTGVFTMRNGSIALGQSKYSNSTPKFQVTSDGLITCEEVKIRYGLEIFSMNANAGYEAYIDFHLGTNVNTSTDYNGRLAFEGGVFRFKDSTNSLADVYMDRCYSYLWASNVATMYNGTSYYPGISKTATVVVGLNVNNEGKVTSYTTGTLQFTNGICVVCPD